jgi:hypothetical protein
MLQMSSWLLNALYDPIYSAAPWTPFLGGRSCLHPTTRQGTTLADDSS